jgi:NAD+--asparagine ADP-ribosyltransferase
VTRHPEPAGIINDDQIRPATFDELGRDAGSGAGSDDGLSTVESVLKAVTNFLTRVGVTFSSPRVGHMSED